MNNPIEYVLESIRTIYGIQHKNGAIRRVNVNIAATTVENYRKLKEAGNRGLIFSFRRLTIRKTMRSFIPPDLNMIMHTIRKPWIGLWRAALMMWESACSLV